MEQRDILALASYLDEQSFHEEEHYIPHDTSSSEKKLAKLFGLEEKPKEKIEKRIIEYYSDLERSQWFASWDSPKHKGWYEVQRNIKYDTISRLYFNGQFWFYKEMDLFFDEQRIVELDGLARWRGLAKPLN